MNVAQLGLLMLKLDPHQTHRLQFGPGLIHRQGLVMLLEGTVTRREGLPMDTVNTERFSTHQIRDMNVRNGSCG
jgi:hypothetical protein